MTGSVTDNMKSKTKSGLQTISVEEFQDLRRQVKELMETATSIQILLQEVTDMEDFKPPIVTTLSATERQIATTSGKLSASVLQLAAQVDRIKTEAEFVYEKQVIYIRKVAAIICLLCNLPLMVGLLVLGRKSGLL